jgi:hypothetical protein
MLSNSRVHLPGGSVTALARKPMKTDHHLVPPGPRRPQLAGYTNVRYLFHHLHGHRVFGVLLLLVALQHPGCLTFSSLQSARIVEPGPPTATFGLGRNNFLENGHEDPGWTVLDLRTRYALSDKSDAAFKLAVAKRDEDGWVGFVLGGDIRASLWKDHLVLTVPAQILAGDFEFSTFQILPGMIGTVPIGRRVEFNSSFNFYVFAHGPDVPMYSFSAGLGVWPTSGPWLLRPEVAWLHVGDSERFYRQLGLALEVGPKRAS